MIVADASVLLYVLLRRPSAERIERRLLTSGETVCAPHLIDLEVAQVLRRFVRSHDLSAGRAQLALDVFAGMAILRTSHLPLLGRIWDLRDTLTAYDAAYVALAESLNAPLLTTDGCLANTHGHTARIELV